MRVQGIEIEVGFEPPVPFTDEWLDAVYTSLEKNMAIVSIDMFVEEDDGKIRFLLGVENPFGTDGFTEDVGRDAIHKAFTDAAGPNTQTPQSDFRASRVDEFA